MMVFILVYLFRTDKDNSGEVYDYSDKHIHFTSNVSLANSNNFIV